MKQIKSGVRKLCDTNIKQIKRDSYRNTVARQELKHYQLIDTQKPKKEKRNRHWWAEKKK
jgi:hypothetical protein